MKALYSKLLSPLFSAAILTFTTLSAVSVSQAAVGFKPPRNLDPASATIRLDSSFQSDAWLVYTYDIDVDGSVVNATIQSSNGVPEVEQAVLRQVNSMRFEPATRNGKAVKVAADPVIYTWILDLPRDMSPRFAELYQQAWDRFAEENYDAAFEIAVELKGYPGRNAFEEVKFQILAASLANRWQDESAEMQHLNRAVEVQNLAINNNFRNRYLEDEQFLRILNRIQILQINRMMLADAAATLERIQQLGPESTTAREAADRYAQAEMDFSTRPELTVRGELMPIYRDGPGAWKTGLSRQSFSLSDVKGRVNAVFLVCDNTEKSMRYPSSDPWQIPVGWSRCKIDISGEAGTRFTLRQR